MRYFSDVRDGRGVQASSRALHLASGRGESQETATLRHKNAPHDSSSRQKFDNSKIVYYLFNI